VIACSLPSIKQGAGMASSKVGVKLMLCGDVMLGRGIDQILPFPGDPVLFEPHIRSALEYVRLAEATNGPIPRAAPFSYVWGDALEVLSGRLPDLRIINLETAATRRGTPEPKGINYRMSPENLGAVTAAGIDCCVLANNHVLDWGGAGLIDTLDSLAVAGPTCVGAGRDEASAAAPAIFPRAGGGRVIVQAVASPSSGVPASWAATGAHPGVNFLVDLSDHEVERIAAVARTLKQPGDVAVLSIHWGGNWGYGIPVRQRYFAHKLIDEAEIDVIHGHSSHHPKAAEVYQGKLILYGCGDFINDYEGIRGYESYSGDLVLMYLVGLAADGTLAGLEMVPFRIRRFRLERAARADAERVRGTMDRECGRFGRRVALAEERVLRLLQD
jgi:poly-gamma-glutamate capsule biosynthesis protein CapA/YwtB (metallophosphatase superfamily)